MDCQIQFNAGKCGTITHCKHISPSPPRQPLEEREGWGEICHVAEDAAPRRHHTAEARPSPRPEPSCDADTNGMPAGPVDGEQTLHRKAFRWRRKAGGGHEQLKGLGNETKARATSGSGTAGPQAHPRALCIPPKADPKSALRRMQTFKLPLDKAAQPAASRGGPLAPQSQPARLTLLGEMRDSAFPSLRDLWFPFLSASLKNTEGFFNTSAGARCQQ